MSALDGFYTTLSQARATFGEGVPQTGEEFDGSARLRQAQAEVEAAAPDDRWQGAAADAYATKNQKHAAVYGKLADLDQRMAAEVTNSASVVTAGRRNLDSLQTWAGNLDSTIPRDQSGDRMRLILASKGMGQITDVIEQSNQEMTAIGGRVDDIRKEYEEILGEDKKSPADEAAEGLGLKEAPIDMPAPAVLDADDIQQLPPGQLGPRGYMELVPGSGTWVPDPSSAGYKPHTPKHPVDLADVEIRGAGSLGLPTEKELIPGSGVWIPDPGQPGFEQHPPEAPFDLNKIVHVQVDPANGVFGPRGYMELGQGSGVWVPDPAAPTASSPGRGF